MPADLDAAPGTDARPTRAELRRQREAAESGATADVTLATAAPPAPPVVATTVPAAAAAAAAPSGRAALREQQQAATQQDNVLVNLLKAWWLYPLLALIALCVFLGWRSTQTPQVPPGVQVSTPAPEN